MPEYTPDVLQAAKQIPGWMSPEELDWLAEQAPSRKVIVEIGVYRGRSTKLLAALTPGTVYAVDDFRGEVDPPPPEFHEGPAQGRNLEKEFRRNLAAEIKAGKVKVIKKPSLEAVKAFRRKADMVFVDGDHKYPAPLEDIKAWSKKLTPAGLIAGHDAPDHGVSHSLQDLGIEGRGPDRIWYAEEGWRP